MIKFNIIVLSLCIYIKSVRNISHMFNNDNNYIVSNSIKYNKEIVF